MSFNSCRFCRLGDREDEHRMELVKYGVRHYAHPDCLLKAKREGAWTLLHDWQLEQFPYFAAKRQGLDESLSEAIRGRREPTQRGRL